MFNTVPEIKKGYTQRSKQPWISIAFCIYVLEDETLNLGSFMSAEFCVMVNNREQLVEPRISTMSFSL